MYIYLGQCDKLRIAPHREVLFEIMMDKKVEIDKEQFIYRTALKSLLEDEPLDEFIGSDPDSKFYKSDWGEIPCKFIQTCGFEFIFIKI